MKRMAAGMDEQLGRTVIELVRVHRLDEADVVHQLADLARGQFAF